MMRFKILFSILMILTLSITLCTNAFAKFDWLKSKIDAITSSPSESLQTTRLSDTKIGEGLKEALRVGIQNTVNQTGSENGYFSNDAIKIVLPEKIKIIDNALRIIGMGDQLDEFTLSMNRAAEKAAPLAKDIFIDAIFNMNFHDVQSIYKGDTTSATSYFKNTTYDLLYKTFSPAVDGALNQYNVTNQYKSLISRYQQIPFAKNLPAPDINDYVIRKALDGLFYVLGEQEKEIRTNPQARVTDLLKEVFKN